MMVFTHALAGLVIGLLVSFGWPTYAVPALAAGLMGGIFPDLDMFFEHRRTLHHPFLASGCGIFVFAVSLLSPSLITVAFSTFLLAAGLHSLMDVFSSGKELRPWERTDSRAVYDHVRQEWIHARRWVYSGSKGDLLLAVGIGVPLLLTVGGAVDLLVRVMLGLSLTYVAIFPWLTRRIPAEYDTLSSFVTELVAGRLFNPLRRIGVYRRWRGYLSLVTVLPGERGTRTVDGSSD